MRAAHTTFQWYLLDVHFISIKISIVRRYNGEVQMKCYEHSVNAHSGTSTDVETHASLGVYILISVHPNLFVLLSTATCT